jgi:hypothetical protein
MMCVCVGEDSEKKKDTERETETWGEKPSSLGGEAHTAFFFFFVVVGYSVLISGISGKWGGLCRKKMRFGDRERGRERERERETLSYMMCVCVCGRGF